MLVAVLLWGLLLAGFTPMSWFLIRFRPSWPPKSPAYLIYALLAALWLGYARIGAVLAIRGWIPRMDGWADALASIAPLVVVDAVVVGLLVSFLRYKAAWKAAMDSFGKGDE